MEETYRQIYKELFRKHYAPLLFYTTRIVGSDDAEDVVQEVFVELWKRKEHIEIGPQIQAYLYRAAYTRALNVLKRRGVEHEYSSAQEEINQKRAEFYQPDHNEVMLRIENQELRQEINSAIGELPA
jgi:RNA polymerase sigma-70 factor (ECF subfamily)